MADDRAREDFFSEAQELIEGFARDLLLLEEGEQRGEPDPDVVNEVFRAVHTLKGLAGLFGAPRMGTLAHNLEEILDEIRLGKRRLERNLLDQLFRAVDVLGAMLLAERQNDRSPMPEADAFIDELAHSRKGRASEPVQSRTEYIIDPELLAVLTEYEEHRLQTNVMNGFALYRIRAQFNLLSLDEELDQLKATVKPLGEIITFLPSGDGGDHESIRLEILMASKAQSTTLTATLSSSNIQIEEVAKRTREIEPRYEASLTPVPASTSSINAAVERPPAAPRSSDISELRPQKQPEPVQGMSLRSVSQTVRVDIQKLDRLMNVVGELALVKSSMARITDRVRAMAGLRELASEMHRVQRTFERHLSAMQDGILEVRMVPLGQIFDKLGRVVRQASREVGKQVNLVITGAETEVDKLIVEELSDPLVHMIRNAIDHGIEGAQDRIAVGKPETGTVAINAFQKGSHVVIEIEDDGRGIDEERIREVAVRRGFITEQEAKELGRRESLNLIFVPGFSTKNAADMLAGRGVGMDIVKTNINRLGGFVDIQSEKGIGTKMTVTLPITLAILSSLVIGVGAQTFALPLSSVQEALAFEEGAIRSVEGRDFMSLRGTTLPIARLSRLFNIADSTSARGGRGFVVVISAGARRLGLVVDHLEGQQDIVIKPLGASLRQVVRGFAGATELGDQRVGLVLDTPSLVDEVLSTNSEFSGKNTFEPRSEPRGLGPS